MKRARLLGWHQSHPTREQREGRVRLWGGGSGCSPGEAWSHRFALSLSQPSEGPSQHLCLLGLREDPFPWETEPAMEQPPSLPAWAQVGSPDVPRELLALALASCTPGLSVTEGICCSFLFQVLFQPLPSHSSGRAVCVSLGQGPCLQPQPQRAGAEWREGPEQGAEGAPGGELPPGLFLVLRTERWLLRF